MTPVTVASAATFGVLAVISGWLVAIDVREHRLPNRLVMPLYPLGLVVPVVALLATGSVDALISAAVSAVAMLLFYGALHAFGGGMGAGDVKLAGALGLFLGSIGWVTPLVATALAFLLGGLWSAWLLARRRAGGGDRIAFGPYLLAGAWLAIGLSAVG